ncbi:NUC188 domain-containing protein [Endogone sp. FLAS-F59071]|nr:NUC188 domain-containing protein [Endogone sp. FLAS-F59071]|eukprot:RUS21833.1 NUC188 domain-containing protein [Endogone sp. FLAS-F59071]
MNQNSSGSPGGGKRPFDGSVNLTGREKKRAKNQVARNIQTQSVGAPPYVGANNSAVASHGSSSGNSSPSGANNIAGGGSQGTFICADCSSGYVPRTVDVVNFAEARAFEINAMHSAIKTASFALNQLSFQSLPRGLRRRAASHNVKRLPVRLREQAKKEVHTLMSSNVSQAEHPNEKSIRASYRASSHLSIIHDASYMGCVELGGPEEALVRMLNMVTDPTMPSIGSARYTKGNRQCQTFLYEYLTYPVKLVCPITAFWRPHDREVDHENKRVIWIWVHPSAFKEALAILRQAVAKVGMVDELSVQDRRGQLLTFELTGPRSTALLQAVFDSVSEWDQQQQTTLRPNIEAHKVALETKAEIRGVDGSGASALIVITTARDCAWTDCLRPTTAVRTFPNIYNIGPCPVTTFDIFPPRTNTVPQAAQRKLSRVLAQWPENVANCDIWDEHNLVPGTKLVPTPADTLVPLLLIQRGTANSPTTSPTRSSSSSEYLGGWTLILPASWGMAFWKSFIFAGARVGGLRERYYMHFESGVSCFPYDFPGTKGYQLWKEKKKVEEEREWAKKPPAKRVNFKKLGVKNPFDANFERLIEYEARIEKDQRMVEGKMKAKAEAVTGDKMEVDLANDGTSNMDVVFDNEPTRPHPRYWLMQSPKLVSALFNSAASFSLEDASKAVTAEVKKYYKARKTLVTAHSNDVDITKALVRVRVSLLRRGVPGPNSMIYLVQEQEAYRKVLEVMSKSQVAKEGKKRKRRAKNGEEEDEWNLFDSDNESAEAQNDGKSKKATYPPESDIVGYVTTGHFSFTQGQGFGLGACSVVGMRKMKALEAE